MAHFPKPWFRAGRGWFLQVSGRQIKLADDKTEAFERYHRIMAGENSGDESVGSIIDSFLEWCSRCRKPRTFDWYKDRCQSFWTFMKEKNRAHLGAAELKPFHVDEWIAAHPTWNPGMIRGAMIAIQRAMNWAVKQGRIAASPIAKMEKPAAGRRDNIITPEMFETILGHVKDRAFTDLLVAAWQTGCRPQEIVRVEARHFDGESAWIFPKEESKGKKRARVIHLTPEVKAMTLRLVAERPTGTLFRNRRGKAWHPWAVNCRFCRLAEKVGRKFALADFRHSFVTRLLKAKIDPITIGALCGHVDLTMIAKTYQHVSEDAVHLKNALTKGA